MLSSFHSPLPSMCVHMHTHNILCFFSNRTLVISILTSLVKTSHMWTCVLSHSVMFQLFATPWTVACQTPLSMEFFRQEYWSRLPFPPPGDLPDPGIEPWSPESPSLASEFFTTEPLGSPTYHMPPSKYIRNTYTERKDKSDIWEWKTSIAESNTTSTCLSLVSSTTIYLTSLLLPYLPSWISSNTSNTVYFRALIIHLL